MNHVHEDSPVWQAHQTDGWFNPLVQNGETLPATASPTTPATTTAASASHAGSPTICRIGTSSTPTRALTSSTTRSRGSRTTASLRPTPSSRLEPIWLDFRSALLSRRTTTKQHIYLVGETFSGAIAILHQVVHLAVQMLDGSSTSCCARSSTRTCSCVKASWAIHQLYIPTRAITAPDVMSTCSSATTTCRARSTSPRTRLSGATCGRRQRSQLRESAGIDLAESVSTRMGTAFAILMTNQGAPMIYYGDEVGLAGAGDPDNRRFMPSRRRTPGRQNAAREDGEGAIRAAHTALRRGNRTTPSSDDSWPGHPWGQRRRPSTSPSTAVTRRRRSAACRRARLADQLIGAALTGPSVTVPGAGRARHDRALNCC